MATTKKKSVKKTSAKKKTAKKAVKKKVAKKKSGRKPKPKTTAQKKQEKLKAAKTVKKNAHPDRVFVMVNGHKLKNVKQLADVMDKIEDHVFNHHVNEDKHDFAVWLRDVFEEIDLAKELADVKDKKHIQLVLYKHISHKLW